mmetsp:Transcript_23796/g.36148  ORF Transcript_23796/g.36148 Transcript_23796/m.36148 type:complete len:153 (-) Transcript_23796:990-1448(-)
MSTSTPNTGNHSDALGRSPQHARNVALVLSLTTGLVSPQFHIKFDPSFHTVKQENFTSSWQLQAGFVSQREKIVSKRDQQILLSKGKQQKRKTDKAASRQQKELPTKMRRTIQSQVVQPSIEQPIVERVQEPQPNQQLNPGETIGFYPVRKF